MTTLWDSRLGRLSVQVLQEYYLTVTVELTPPREPEEAREDVIALTGWRPATPDPATLERAWDPQDASHSRGGTPSPSPPRSRPAAAGC